MLAASAAFLKQNDNNSTTATSKKKYLMPKSLLKDKVMEACMYNPIDTTGTSSLFRQEY
jgi:hypothetical protein